MQGIFVTLGYGFLALIGISVLVALAEYVRSTRRPLSRPGVPPLTRAVSVDLDLDHIDSPGPGDQTQRQATVDQALARMSQGSPEQAWIETRPTVLNGSVAAETTR